MAKKEAADLVVVGAGLVGGWASWFAATSATAPSALPCNAERA